MRNSQVSRIYKILTLLESSRNGLSVKDIHDHIQQTDPVTDRTVRRDLEALEQAGFPLHRDPNPRDEQAGDLYSIQSSVRVAKHLTLSAKELFALYLTRGMLIPLKETAVFADLDNVFKQIDSLLSIQSREHISELVDEIKFEPGPRWGLGIDPDLLDTMVAACTNNQIVEIEYQAATRPERVSKKLGPHFLYMAKGTVYLVAEDLGDSTVKIFSLARCSNALMTDQPYDKKQIEPEEYFKGSFGVYRADKPERIEILVKANSAPYVTERKFHGSQRVIKNADGSVLLTFDVGVTPDLVQFVLGFGDTMEVRAPTELKSRVAAAAKRVAEMYG